MKKICEAFILLVGTLGWWGFVYPDLCLTEETYEQEYKEPDEKSEDKSAGKYESGIEGQPESKKAPGNYDFFTGQSQGYKARERSGKPDKKEALTGKEKENPAEISGTIRIKSRLMEYVYQDG